MQCPGPHSSGASKRSRAFVAGGWRLMGQRFGIVSDIHGNLHAFQAVLSRLGELGIDDLLCLGDVVGYGPFPDACLDLVDRSSAG